MTGNLPFWTVLIFSQASVRSDRYGAFAFFEMIPSRASLAACSNTSCPSPMRCSLYTIGASMPFSPIKSSSACLRSICGSLRRSPFIPPEKVEGVINQPVLPTSGKVGLEFREVGTSFMDDHHLPVEDGLAGDIQGAGNCRKPFGPVQAVAGVDLAPAGVDADLDAVAVVLDFVKPLTPYRSLGLQGGQLGFNEPRHLDFATHSATHKKPPPTATERRRTGFSLPVRSNGLTVMERLSSYGWAP